MITKLTVDDIKALAYHIKKESKMKEMYLKGRYFGKCLDMCYEEEYYGNFGDTTDMTYEDGSPLHTGDIVELRCKDGSIMGHRIVAQTKQRYGVIGVASNKFINGESGSWRIKLVCKYYNNNETKVGNIIIKTTNNDQFIQPKGGNTMQITAKLKHKQQLMSLPTFEQEYNDKLWFDDFFVSERMLNKGTLELHWDKQFKSLSDDENYSYNLDWLDTLTFTDYHNRFSFELRIDGLNVTIKPINLYEVAKLSFKDKFTLRVAIHSYCPTALYDNMLHLNRESATHTFKSHKALTKFIGRLCRVKE